MPIPFPQDQTDKVTLDSQGEQAQASIPATYEARAAQTLQDGTFIGDAYKGVTGALAQRDGSEMLNPEDAKNEYGNGGLTHFDSPVSRSYAELKSGQDAQKAAIDDTLERGGINSAKNTWLGFGLSTAVGFLDPISDAAAIASDGITKFNPIARPLGDIAASSAIGGRLASGVVKAAAFSGITEPIHYALDDNWSMDEAAQRLGSGALFLGLTEGLFGHTPLKFFSEDAENITPEQEASYNLLEDHLAPETKVALSQASVARAKAGQDFDPLNALVGLDPRIVAHEAVTGELSFDERAKVLASMDDGTYVPPSLPKEEGTLATTESSDVTPNNDQTVSLPATKNNGGFINLQPIVQALTKQRVSAIQQTAIAEQTTKPPSIVVTKPNDSLTEQDSRVTTLLEPYEHKTETQPIQTGSSGGTMGRTGTVDLKDKASPTQNKWGGLPAVRTGGASFLARGGRLRFRNPETYEHGAITFVRDAGNKFVASRAAKGTFTPSSTKSFDSFGEAHNWLKKNNFTEARQVAPLVKEGEQVENKVTLPKEKTSSSSLQNKEKGFEIMEHDAPDTPVPIIRQAEDAQISRQKAINGLRKYGLKLHSADGGWWPDGVETEDGKQIYKYGTAEFDKIFGHARELVENFIHKFRAFHNEYMLSEAAQNDFTRVGEMPHQLPKQLDKLEGYKLFTLHNRNSGVEPTSSWSNDTSLEAHAHLSVLKDKDGNPYLAVHEAQGGFSDNLSAEEGMKMIADRIREYAQEQGLPVVLPSTRTATTIYGRGELNGTFTRAYSKGGYVRNAFRQAFETKNLSRIELEKLWAPMVEGSHNFEGLHVPDETDMVKTASEIDKEEQEKQPGYEQASRCVGATA